MKIATVGVIGAGAIGQAFAKRAVAAGLQVTLSNTLRAELLADDPHVAGGRRVLFFSGDDSDAKAKVAGLIDRLGFAGVDLGGLVEGGRLQQFPGGPLPTLNLVKLA